MHGHYGTQSAAGAWSQLTTWGMGGTAPRPSPGRPPSLSIVALVDGIMALPALEALYMGIADNQPRIM
jgi:hypothetical protein